MRKLADQVGRETLRSLEARVGIEPTYEGFADPLVPSPTPSDSTPLFQKLESCPLFVRPGGEFSSPLSESGKVLQSNVYQSNSSSRGGRR